MSWDTAPAPQQTNNHKWSFKSPPTHTPTCLIGCNMDSNFDKQLQGEYSKGWGGSGSSSTAMAEEACCDWLAGTVALGFEETAAGASVRVKTSGSEGWRSLSRTNPDGASLTGTYRHPSKNLMYFSCEGTTLAGFIRIWNVGSGSGFFSAGVSTWAL